ncbi:hypothetical protein ACLOJK_036161 [Asimina triloba]
MFIAGLLQAATLQQCMKRFVCVSFSVFTRMARNGLIIPTCRITNPHRRSDAMNYKPRVPTCVRDANDDVDFSGLELRIAEQNYLFLYARHGNEVGSTPQNQMTYKF